MEISHKAKLPDTNRTTSLFRVILNHLSTVGCSLDVRETRPVTGGLSVQIPVLTANVSILCKWVKKICIVLSMAPTAKTKATREENPGCIRVTWGCDKQLFNIVHYETAVCSSPRPLGPHLTQLTSPKIYYLSVHHWPVQNKHKCPFSPCVKHRTCLSTLKMDPSCLPSLSLSPIWHDISHTSTYTAYAHANA